MTTIQDNLFRFGSHLEIKLTKYSFASILVILYGISLLIVAGFNGSLVATFIYLGTMFLCFMIVEWIAFTRRFSASPLPVKNAKKESALILFSVLMVTALVIARFIVIQDIRSLNPILRIGLMVSVFLFIYPVFLAIYFFLIKKYTLKELGFGWQNWWVALPIIFTIGFTTVLLLPEKIQFCELAERNGFLALFAMGFLTAAIPEEFVRVLTQTRLGGYFSNKGLGWLVASLIWALIHIPNFYSQSKDYIDAIISALGILPIGLLWGYMTDRFKSILPSTLVHGTNLWGLQNIF